ncbi:type IV secretion system DNA-binding domain-containing protein [Synechococcales cyanobacterium C]|uniref:Type IV secretion system DNA-binding domain-containing protein n=1 Tax=Petrachloros mirabilis ULC683 TaxID=2781853 RepID=A0A8K2A228_9CYAN|nr:DUF87 domain-containing protein [Petrachloros mirabilis]NCJ08077.1 type IV secretion system DNA-binding domain-containing protein [Petrachloros mirabilis ULC683]
MDQWQTQTIFLDETYLALGGVYIQQLLSAELFRDLAGYPLRGPAQDIALLCRERWLTLSDAIATLPEPLECFLLVIGQPNQLMQRSSVIFLAAGRHPDAAPAELACQAACKTLWTLLSSSLDYLELSPLPSTPTSSISLQTAIAALQQQHGVELRRRWEQLCVVHGDRPIIEPQPTPRSPKMMGFQFGTSLASPPPHPIPSPEVMGFQTGTSLASPPPQPKPSPAQPDPIQDLKHLFAWTPSADSWERLFSALQAEPEGSALVVHLRGGQSPPEHCKLAAREALAAAEQILKTAPANLDLTTQTLLELQTSVIRSQSLQRVAILANPVIAARVFISAPHPPSPALLSTVKGCLDAVPTDPKSTESMFQGGIKVVVADQGDHLAPLTPLTLDLLFSPAEACAFLRTPMPTDSSMGDLPISRARTTPFLGQSGSDYLLGENVHRGERIPVAIEDAMRFRHTYIIGQTGTGKSTLMLQMILHDIEQGRGVGVLDPHGTLIDEVLARYPKHRAKDLVWVDVTDTDYPIGYNLLNIQEKDPVQYQIVRDLVIDELYAYLDQTYELSKTGGPIFESHFRGMLGLLMGIERPPEPPHLMLLRTLYTNKKFRTFLVERIKDKDIVLEEFIQEALQPSSSSDHNIANISGYITSKFNRFIADRTLRNVICQKRSLDLEDIVASGKVLLFYLGKGRFGEQAAGLLASQIITGLRRVVMKRNSWELHRPFYLYADEFHLFANHRFAELLSEARKFGLSLTLAHQYVQQIPEPILQAILGNVGTTIALRVGAVDGSFLEPIYSPYFNHKDLLSLPNYRAYVRSCGTLGESPFSVSLTPPKPVVNSPQHIEAFRNASRRKYGHPREAVEQEIAAAHQAYKEGLFDPNNLKIDDFDLSELELL